MTSIDRLIVTKRFYFDCVGPLFVLFIISGIVLDIKCSPAVPKNATDSNSYLNDVIGISDVGEVRINLFDCPKSRSLTVTWDYPEKRKEPLDGYAISLANRKDGSESTVDVNSEESSYTFNNLGPYTKYSIKIRPFNLQCSPSAKMARFLGGVTEIETSTAPAGPSISRNIKAYVLSTNIVQLNWAEPESKNGPLSGYVVEWQCKNRPGCPLLKVELGGYETNFVITGLRPYTKYSIVVKAFNVVTGHNCIRGQTEKLYSDDTSIEIETPVAGSPVIETFVVEPSTGTSTGASVVLSWKVKTDEFAPPTKLFRIEYKLKGQKIVAGSVECNSVDGLCSDLRYKVEGLQPSTEYEFFIRAKFENGSYGANKATETLTCPSATLPPVDFKLSSRSESTITLTWQGFGKQEGNFDGYTLKWTDPMNSEINEERVTTMANYTVNYLQEFRNYEFSLSTYHFFGDKFCQGETTDLTTRTSAGKPSDPLSVVAVARSSTQVHLSWMRPRKPRGNIEGYLISWVSADGLSTGTNNETSEKEDSQISDLEPYTDYSFAIYAYNEDDGQLKEGDEAITRKLVRTYTGAPGPVSNGRVYGHNPTSITVKWNKPLKPNGPLSGYCVSIDKKEDCTLGNNTNSHTFYGLSPRTSYEIQILAYNEDDSPSNKGKRLRGVPIEL